jgi:hypothetical protein
MPRSSPNYASAARWSLRNAQIRAKLPDVSEDLDAERFPTVAEYLRGLPGGLAAYPDCKVRGGLVNSILQAFELDARGLPDSLCQWIDSPPLQSEWMPQVAARAFLRVLFDQQLKTREAYLQWAYESQKKVLSGPLYRILFLGISPQRLVRVAASRYAHFHQGLTFTIEHQSSQQATAMLRYPTNLCTPFDHVSTLEGLRGGIELAGGKQVQTRVVDHTHNSARLQVDWKD